MSVCHVSLVIPLPNDLPSRTSSYIFILILLLWFCPCISKSTLNFITYNIMSVINLKDYRSTTVLDRTSIYLQINYVLQRKQIQSNLYSTNLVVLWKEIVEQKFRQEKLIIFSISKTNFYCCTKFTQTCIYVFDDI